MPKMNIAGPFVVSSPRYNGEMPDELKPFASMDRDISGRGSLSGEDMCGVVVFWTKGGW
jgi:hypothetical protein